MIENKNIDIDIHTAYRESISFLKECSGEYGFLASTTERANYRRVWGRDGNITGIAALLSEDDELTDIYRRTLETLGKYQGRQGQIPSNVDPENDRISYGMTSGRVDATLWYVIGFGQYVKRTEDGDFFEKNREIIDRCMWILEAWEFNQKDFIFIPDSGDWADESPRHGYILYDQLLYHQAIREYAYLLDLAGEDNSYWVEKSRRLKNKIRTNFWMKKENVKEEYIYHPEMFDNAFREFEEGQKYWIEDFHHHALYKRFDAFANILTMLLDFSDEEQREKINDYISGIVGAGYLVPAFFPVISPEYEEEWKEMRGSYSFYFKNRPYHAHNGGLWPMVTGFYVAALSKYGNEELGHKYLKSIGHANYMDKKGDEWGFYEYHHGLKKTPEGTRGVAWNAAGHVIGYKTRRDGEVFKQESV